MVNRKYPILLSILIITLLLGITTASAVNMDNTDNIHTTNTDNYTQPQLQKHNKITQQ